MGNRKVEFGLALKNFTGIHEQPDVDGLLA